MGLKNQTGQVLVEFIFMFFLLMTVLLTIERLIQQKNAAQNNHKFSTEVKNEFRYKNKN